MHWYPFPALFVGGEIIDLVRETGAVAQIVLLSLLAFSLISWAIILSRWSMLRRARVQSGRFLRAFRRAQRLQDIASRVRSVPSQPSGRSLSGRVQGIRAADGNIGRVSVTAVQRAMQIANSEELTRFERNLPWLAITGGGHAVCRALRHSMGHHRCLSRTRHYRRRNIARSCSWNFGSPDYYCRWPRGRHPCGHRLQL